MKESAVQVCACVRARVRACVSEACACVRACGVGQAMRRWGSSVLNKTGEVWRSCGAWTKLRAEQDDECFGMELLENKRPLGDAVLEQEASVGMGDCLRSMASLRGWEPDVCENCRREHGCWCRDSNPGLRLDVIAFEK